MAKKTSAEKLADDIDAIMKDYADGTIEGLNNVIKQLTSKARNAVKRNAREVTSKARRRYSNGWMYKVDKSSNQWAATGVVYNKNQPGLAHLLEHGHAKRGGGRTKGRPHVAPVEEQVANEALSELKREI